MKSRIKQTIICLSALLLFSVTAQADVLCMSKSVKVRNAKINMKDNLKVVSGTDCPKNFAVLLNVDSYLSGKADADTLRNYATKASVNAALKDKANTVDVVSALAKKASKAELAGKASVSSLNSKADAADLATYATKTYVADALTNKANADALDAKLNRDGDIRPGETMSDITISYYQSYYSGLVRLPISLPQEISPEILGTKEECTGSAFQPTAPEGKMCLYATIPNKYLTWDIIPYYPGEHLRGKTNEKCELIEGAEWIPPACVINSLHPSSWYDPISKEADCLEVNGASWDAAHSRCITDQDEASCTEACIWDPDMYNEDEKENGTCVCRGVPDYYREHEHCGGCVWDPEMYNEDHGENGTCICGGEPFYNDDEEACENHNSWDFDQEREYVESDCITPAWYSRKSFDYSKDDRSTQSFYEIPYPYFVIWAYTAPVQE